MHVSSLLFRTAVVLGLPVLMIPAAPAGDTSFSLLQRGRYLVNAGDCAACHTNDPGKPFAGGRAIPTPFGNIFSTNITPDKETGIGRWSEQDFYRAMHDGIDREGEHLYPAFPYPWFTKLTHDDVNAIKAYLDTLEPVRQENKPAQLPWPMSWRGSLAAWNRLYFQPGSFQPRSDKSAAWNRGAYLVEGVGHCGACHTPKNTLGAVKHDAFLGGGDSGEHWFAPRLSGERGNGLGDWAAADIVEYLKTGSNANTAATGPMAEVVKNSTQYLNDSDLNAIAVYLKDLPPQQKATETTAASVDRQTLTRGEGLYIDNCAGCHMENGGGQKNVFPAIKGNSAIQAQQPDTLIHLLIDGGKIPATASKPTGLAMPSFSTKLNDSEVADLVTYVRNAWGNHAPAVSKDAVSAVRKDVMRSSGE